MKSDERFMTSLPNKSLDFASLLPQNLLDAYIDLRPESWHFAILCYLYSPLDDSLSQLPTQLVKQFLTDRTIHSPYAPIIDKNNNFTREMVNFLQKLKNFNADETSTQDAFFFDDMHAKALTIIGETDNCSWNAARNSSTLPSTSDIPPATEAFMLHRVLRSGWIRFAEYFPQKPRAQIELADDVAPPKNCTRANECATIRAFLTRKPRVENVADHSFKTAVLAYLLSDPEYAATSFLFGLCHDWPELITGDVTPHDNVDKATKRANECAAYQQIIDRLASFDIRRNPIGRAFPTYCKMLEIDDLTEYSAENSHLKESFFSDGRAVLAAHTTHIADKIDMLIQACAYESNDGMDFSEIIQSAHEQIETSFNALNKLKIQTVKLAISKE